MIKQQNGKGIQNLVKLSVIIPVYNVAEYLEQCINSVLKQEYDKYELILVDDGSPMKVEMFATNMRNSILVLR